MSRSRNYCFTINNYEIEDEDWCYSISWMPDYRYVCVGKEIGDSGTPHLQGVVCWTTMKSLNQMKELHPRAHWEAMRGTAAQAAEYCKKDGDFYEAGEAPFTQEQKGLSEKDRWAHALLAVREGRLEEIPADIIGRHLKSLEYAARALQPEAQLLDGVLEHEWWYGSPGTGKTRKAYEENPGAYFKDPKERWWDGYKGEDVVIVDDFDKYQISQGGDMKRWLDRYPFQAPVKGGYINIRPRKIIITSNYHPDDIWEDQITQAAIGRRVKVVSFDEVERRPHANCVNFFTPGN